MNLYEIISDDDHGWSERQFYEKVYEEINAPEGFNYKSFWMSVSKEKTLSDCGWKFIYKYIEKLPDKKRSRITYIGTFIHDAFDETYKEGIRDYWYDMTQPELQKELYNLYRAKIEKQENFDYWCPIYENNVVNLSTRESNRFFGFLSEIGKEKMNDYFLPVFSEGFLKHGLFRYNYIPDAIFRIYKTGDPKKDLDLLIFDLKGGSAQPKEVRSKDKGQVFTYSLFWNTIKDNLKAVKDNEAFYKKYANIFEGVVNATNEPSEKVIKKLKYAKEMYEGIRDSNKKILSVPGKIKFWSILYLGNDMLVLDKGKLPELKKRGITAAKDRMTKYRTMVEEKNWKDAWGSRTCKFDWFERISQQQLFAECDHFDICFKRKNQDLFVDDIEISAEEQEKIDNILKEIE